MSIDQLGMEPVRGFMIVGQRAGDQLGGGDLSQSEGSGATRGRSHGLAGAGDVDGDGRDDLLVGAILADPHPTPDAGVVSTTPVRCI